jgi:mannose-6-phosphate isomerase
MQTTKLYPLLLSPALHTRVWGGRRLATMLHKDLPTPDPYGESWEVHDSATVVNGEFAGRKVGELVPIFGADLIGVGNDPAEGLPLLVKFLDANEWLSVQVHPNDEQARRLEGEPRGKSEAWYVMAAEPKAKLVVGVVPDATPETMAEAIRAKLLDGMLVYVEVEAGSVLYIPAGTIHALGPGLMVYEIQQSSDTTYRLYDWGRLGLDGKPRALNIDKGVAVSRLGRLPNVTYYGAAKAPVVQIVNSPFFQTVLHQLDGGAAELDTEGRVFHTLTCVEGTVTITAGDTPAVTLELGQSALIPAAVGRYTLSGATRVLRSYQRA